MTDRRRPLRRGAGRRHGAGGRARAAGMRCLLRVLLPSLLVACAALSLPALGYDYDYDYQGQGDDWYGKSGRPYPGRDYPAFFIDEYSAGDDYGYGYDAAVDLLDFGPPLVLTRERHTDYHFHLWTLRGCLLSSDCDNGLFCDGAEICGSAGCSAGTPPCLDSDPCTLETCDEAQNTCSYPPPPPPPGVNRLDLALNAPASTVATLSWTAVSSADFYDTYRGEDPQVSDLACFVDRVPGTTLDDDGATAPSGLFVYLVSAVHCSQESDLGADSGGANRPNGAPCP